MATTSTSTAAAGAESVFNESEQLALAGFPAGCTGLVGRIAPGVSARSPAR
jgi:hypothetical protein